MYKFSEYVSPGHPDKVADYISEYILDRYIEKDPETRYAVEVMIKGDMVHLAGEISSKAYFDYADHKRFVQEALREIGYTEEYAKTWEGNVIDPSEINLNEDLTMQSLEISQGVNKDGWGDQGIFFGFADPNGDKYMMPKSHSLAKSLCHMLYKQAKDKGIGGIDIKTEVILKEGDLIEKIIAAVPCRNEEEYGKVVKSIREWYDKVEVDSECYPNIILNGTGNYTHHSPLLDCGVTGRKLAVDFYGGEFQVGGGSPWTKDKTKADLTLNLYARRLALLYATQRKEPVKVSLACCIGQDTIDVSIDNLHGENIETYRDCLSPSGLAAFMGLNKPIFASMCTFGLFGEFQKDKEWEKVY